MAAWLVIIDMQEVFTDPSSDWYSPGAGELVGPITRLARAAGSQVALTRFVAPARPAGAWRRYYEQWPFALQPEDAPIYRLVDGLPSGPVLDCTTFSKWGPALHALIGDDELVLCGVATDCCVLSTAVAAADAGVEVRVITDACAGSTPVAHDQALAVLEGYSPIISLSTLDTELGAIRRRRQ
jgi:nicotinamidase-related amidase